LISSIIFIVLNILFFTMLLFFVYDSSQGVVVYEQTYAKQIALLIDRAHAPSTIHLDFSEGLNLLEKDKLTAQAKDDLVRFGNHKVIVTLGDGEGYSFEYFSSYRVQTHFEGDALVLVLRERGAP